MRKILSQSTASPPGKVAWKTRAQNTIAKALTFFDQKEFAASLQTIETASDIWPEASRLPETHRRIAERYQQVNVGVLRFADDPKNYPFPTDAESRINNLKEAYLFENQNAQEIAALQ
ncbi:MAG: hypothetical protein R3C11_04105 [Planctomycetaceae bacterium]